MLNFWIKEYDIIKHIYREKREDREMGYIQKTWLFTQNVFSNRLSSSLC